MEQNRASLFSFITLNWRGKPLRSFKTIVQLIAATTTKTGLTVRAELDKKNIPKASKPPMRTRRYQPHPPRLPRRLELHLTPQNTS